MSKRATLTFVQSTLGGLGIGPSKSLSQNFLIDPNITRKIVNAAGVCAQDHVIEIGPGLGALSEELIETGARVTVIEKDKRLIPILENLEAEKIYCDARDVKWSELITPGCKIVANLPYNITTDLIAALLPHIESLTVMVQRELALRLLDPKPSRALGALIHATCDIEEAFPVSHNCFFPKPHITSSIIKITRRHPVPEGGYALFQRVYQSKRKMLRASVPNCASVGIDPTKRVEALNHDQLRALLEV